MADVFTEYMVTRKKTVTDRIIGVLYIMAFVFLNMAFLFVEFLFILLPLGLIGGGWLLVRLIGNQWVEYEYIVTNGTVDVDKIVGRRKRKRLTSVDCKSFEILAPVNSSYYIDYQKNSNIKILDASSGANPSGTYFAVCPSKEGGRMLLLFEPNEKMMNVFMTYISRVIKQ